MIHVWDPSDPYESRLGMVQIPMIHVWTGPDVYESRLEWWIDTLRSIDLGVKSPVLDPFWTHSEVHSGVLLDQNTRLWSINMVWTISGVWSSGAIAL